MSDKSVRAAGKLFTEIVRLKEQNHNLNWALGTPGYETMATPEQQAEADKSHAEVMARIEEMGERKTVFDKMKSEIADLTQQLAAANDRVTSMEHYAKALGDDKLTLCRKLAAANGRVERMRETLIDVSEVLADIGWHKDRGLLLTVNEALTALPQQVKSEDAEQEPKG